MDPGNGRTVFTQGCGFGLYMDTKRTAGVEQNNRLLIFFRNNLNISVKSIADL